MLYCAGGGEEGHTSGGIGIGPWYTTSGVTLDATYKYTGAYGFKFANNAAGGCYLGTEIKTTGVWWSFPFRFTMWGNGTYFYLFKLASAVGWVRQIGWVKGSDTAYAKLALFSGDTGTVLAQSTVELAYATWAPIKGEYANGVWTFWGNFGAGWVTLLTYTEPSPPADFIASMHIASWTNETKGADYFIRWVDDVHGWDKLGDNWNSRIATLENFPRVSVAHFPITPDSHSVDPLEYGNLDEIPPNYTDYATIDQALYWSNFQDLSATVDKTIQAVMVTHVAFNADYYRLKKYNVRESGVLYPDSEEDGRWVQQGETTTWAATRAGYYPWTPGAEANWTPTNFNACEYGVDLILGKTDQITVQAIYFGTAHEWPPPPVVAYRRRLAAVI